VKCHLSDNVEEFLAEAGDFLDARPVENNLLLTLAQMRRRNPEPSRWLWVTDDAVEDQSLHCEPQVVGAAVQTPISFRAALTPMPTAAVQAMVEGIAEEAPDLPGVVGDATTASAFAGAWTTALGVPGHPLEGQRLYRLGDLTQPEDVPGQLRVATQRDIRLLVRWWMGFDEETMLERPASDDRAAVMGARVESNLVWIWEVDERPVSMALHTAPAADAVRIGLVFTPPDQRRKGYAAACVGAVSQVALDAGAKHCLLYTQLSNPTSNRVYQRLGYEPLSEILIYGFG
jgi:GNAT superfamily N-acetyltransferase